MDLDKFPSRESLFNRIYIAVFVSGTSVMGLEILSGRLIAPTFGSTIYTWGSIIGVFMVALGLGYYLGGKKSEHNATREALSLRLLVAAFIIAIITFIGSFIIDVSSTVQIPLRFQPLLPLTILFGPPVFVLGYISPYAAELSEKDSKGGAAGHVYSIGTIGSITGSFLTTFVLIPSLPVKTIQMFFVSLLVIGALVVNTSKKSVLIAVMVVFVTTASFGAYTLYQNETVVYETETPYQHLEIQELEGIKYMYLNGSVQSAEYTDSREGYVFEYLKYIHVSELYTDDIDNVLVIGGGAYSTPKRFSEMYDADVDVVELDPDVVYAAEEYYGVDPEKYDTKIMDGREYLDQNEKKYDVIILDAFQKNNVPFHMATQEFMQVTSDNLTEDGVFVANIISSYEGPAAKFHNSFVSTTDTVYPNVDSYPTKEDPQSVQNIIVVGSKDTYSKQELENRMGRQDTAIDLDGVLAAHSDSEDIEDGMVLTDDYSPVDQLLDPLAGRQYQVQEVD